MLDVPPEPQLEAQLMAASGGNPLFLAQMATMLVEEGFVETVGGRMVAMMSPTTPVPASIQALAELPDRSLARRRGNRAQPGGGVGR